jgi:type I restriction enzyme S subunit
MNKYQSYKSSGVEWIGEIPSHWEILKIKHCVNPLRKITYGIVQPGEEDPNGKLMIRGKDYSNGWVNTSQVFKVSEKVELPYKRSRVEMGDIVYTIVGGLGNCEIVPKEYHGSNLTQTTGRISVNEKTSNKFLYYNLKSRLNELQLGFTHKGSVLPGISLDTLSNFFVIRPPLNEQLQIVQLLDEKTELIDKLISTKERKINLLKEQRISLINQVVTKGLNPNVKLKDSGVEWIGEIPEGWNFVNFGRICNVRQGLQIPFDDRLSEKVENSFEYITTQSVHNPDQYKQYILNPKPNVICNENDILMGRTGNTGEVVTNVNGVFHNNFFLIDFNRKIINKEFLVWYLTNPRLREELLLLSGTTTIPDLNHGKFLSTKFVYPNLKEQLHIVEHLDIKTKEIDDLVQLEKKKIDLLKEYRKSLISEVVTGKTKVTK